MDLNELIVDSVNGLVENDETGVEVNGLIILGRVSKRRESGKSVSMMVVECPICKQDTELYGDGLFKIHRGHLFAGIKPCGCGIRTRWTEQQYLILCQRAAASAGLEFTGWVGEFNKNQTRAGLICPIHGEIGTKAVYQLINAKSGCRDCWYAVAPILRPKSDDYMISGFFESESFSPNTIFYRSERKSITGKKVYWYVECPDCGEVGESVSSDLKAGKRPCNCSIRMPKYSYLLLLSEDTNPICLKLGISSNFKRRFKDLIKGSKYDVEVIGLWEYNTYSECRKAELECLRNIHCGILTKELLSNGYTETASLDNLEEVIKIFEENGGIRLTVH